MLRSMYTHSTAVQQRAVLASIVGSARLRGHREAMAASNTKTEAAALAGGKHRRVYTAEHGTILPGTLVMQEGDPASTDAAVNEAYDGAGWTYDLFWEAYERDSLDAAGLTLDSTVHFQRDYDNAFWDGKQMVYGDGDGELFNRFTLALDVIGHELTHGVTQFTSNLNYSGQSGALNESYSDVFGSLVKQWQRGQPASEADWLVGQGLFTSEVNGVALRSMKEPGTAYDDPVLGKDPQPAHMRDYVVTLEDNGGVHVNSGIPNHAFFLAAVAMGGHAWERAGRIWYIAGRDRMRTNTNFQGAADLTFEVARALYGEGSAEQQAVQYGWESVGITIGAQPQSQPRPSGCSIAPLTALRTLVRRSVRIQDDPRIELR
ncbi:MAG: M4 family metallopeptidase [Chloroflexota bacterium]